MVRRRRRLTSIIILTGILIILFLQYGKDFFWQSTPREYRFYHYGDLNSFLCLDYKGPPTGYVETFRRCPRKSIITVHHGGSLEHLMWQYVTVWMISRRNDLLALIPDCIYLDLGRSFMVNKFTLLSMRTIGHCPTNNILRMVLTQDQWQFSNESLMIGKYAIPEDRSYFRLLKTVIKEFTFQKQFLEYQQAVFADIKRLYVRANQAGCVFIGMHISRSDFFINKLKRRHVRPAGTIFYRKAMGYYEKKYKSVFFVILTDDIAWSRKTFRNHENVHVASTTYLPFKSNYELSVMAFCKHTIFDYSAFGMWGALMAGGETVYYQIQDYWTESLELYFDDWHAIDES